MADMFSEMDEFFTSRAPGNSASVNGLTPSDNLAIFYEKLEEMGFNLDELRGILDCKESMLIPSCAGAGKTTALILKIIHDMISGDLMRLVDNGINPIYVPYRVLVCTFLKSGAEDLEKSFKEWCAKLGLVGIDPSYIKFRTIHSEVYSALKDMGVSIDIMENADSILRQVVQSYGIRSVMATSRSITMDELSDIACVVSYARNRLDAEKYNHPLMADYTMSSIELDAVIKDYKRHRMALGKMDFEDMQELLLDGLQKYPNVVEFIKTRYDCVFVDEFQDTSQLQYEILKTYFNGAKRFLAIGDDDQTIYSWRGSDSEIITHRFEEDYHPVVMKLSTNYRCSENILNAVIPSISCNTKRHNSDLRSARPGGVVNIVVDSDVNELMKGVRVDLAAGNTVGILARTNNDLLIPAILMEIDSGVDFALSKSVSLNSRVPRQVFGVIDLFTKRYTEEFENLFKLFLPRFKGNQATTLANTLAMNRSLSIFTIPERDLEYSVPDLASVIKAIRQSKKEGNDPVVGYITLLEYLQNVSYAGPSIYAQRARDFIFFVKKIITEHRDIKDMTIEQLDTLFNSTLPEKLARRVKYGRGTYVKLSTVHEAKGKEWDSVYIWNDVNGAFPNSVGNRELTPAEFEEERRVHYIAWTRAKSKLTVFTRSSNRGGFLEECDLSGANTEVTEFCMDAPRLVHRGTKIDPSEGEKVVLGQNFLVWLGEYLQETTAGAVAGTARGANAQVVTSYCGADEIWSIAEASGLLNTPQEMFSDTMDDFFNDMADYIMENGTLNGFRFRRN